MTETAIFAAFALGMRSSLVGAVCPSFLLLSIFGSGGTEPIILICQPDPAQKHVSGLNQCCQYLVVLLACEIPACSAAGHAVTHSALI